MWRSGLHRDRLYGIRRWEKFGAACVEAAFARRLHVTLARRNRVSKLERPYIRSGPAR